MESLINNLFSIFTIVLLVLLYPLARVWAKRRNQQLQQAFHTVAARRQGSVVMENSNSPCLKLNTMGIDVALRFRLIGLSGRKRRPFTELEAFLNDGSIAEFVLETQGVFPSLDALAGVNRPETSHQKFDQAFSIQSRNNAWVNTLLTPDVRDALLRFIRESPSYRIEWKNSKLTLLKYGTSRNAEFIDRYLDAALAVVEAFIPVLKAQRTGG